MNKAKQIQWFPGHMFKSLREIKEKINLMDLVLVLLDSRLPDSSMNPELLKIVGHKPIILLFNKMDLADQFHLNRWMKYYEEKGYYTLKIDAQSGKNVQRIHKLSEEVLKDKIDRARQKGLKQRAFRTMIIGVPNVGKSTLINRLAQKKAAKTANTPGVTKAQQWIKLSDQFELLDTPGVLWPKFDDQKIGYHLAITGAIKDSILPDYDLFVYAIDFLSENYQKRLEERYGALGTSISEWFEIIASKRGAYLKEKEIDETRVIQVLLHDIRNNHLGGLTFDRLDV
ncbi:MAG: ribosome biogenesis GTPase YlqF [Acholeplasmataceae bacterium]